MTAEQLNSWIDWAMNLGAAPFTVLAIIAFGYVLRLIPIFPNKWIPVSCVIVGTIIFPCLMHPHQGDSAASFYIRTIFMGMIIGFGSWAFHDKIFSKVEDKIPVLKSIVAIADKENKLPETDEKPPVQPPKP